MKKNMRVTLLLVLVAIASYAQAPNTPKPEPDVIIFADGERLIGKMVRSTADKVTFKSDAVGEVTVEWSKVKELHTSQQFAIIGKNVELKRHPDTSKIPQGTVSVTDQKIEVRPSAQPPQIIPIPEMAHVVDIPEFEKAVRHQSFLNGWTGSLTGGASLVEATQKSNTFTGGFNFIRAMPTVDWIDPRNRTQFDFNAAYGKVTQPGTPSVKTEIFHAHAERDEYVSKSIFLFGAMAFDHNFSQGLDLQQTYGGGVGWTAVRNDKQELDLKAAVTYIRQSFAGMTASEDLIGSAFSENYNRKFAHGMLLNQGVTFLPAWNNTNAYSGVGRLSLTIPFYKRLNFATGVVDTFLNNPPPGFKKNSFQFTLGVTYTLP
jgi:hypothetical protein